MNNSLIERFGAERRWVNWKYEMKDGKKTKIPYRSRGVKAESDDPSTWLSLEDAEANLDNGSNGFDGIGIQFGLKGNLLGIDIDHCFGENNISEEDKLNISKFIIAANTYTEYSPSKTGLHLYLWIPETIQLDFHKKEPFELYSAKRYFTFTGNHYGIQKEVRTVTLKEAYDLIAITGYPWNRDKVSTQVLPTREEQIGDSELLEKMFASKNGNEVKALYNGDTSSYNDDDSRADMALCSHLAFWTGRNTGQIERIWLSSPLGQREKTQKRKDYRDRTISNSIDGVKEIYEGAIELGTPKKFGEGKEKPEDIRLAFIPSMSFSELMSKEFPKARYVVEPFFEAGTVNMVSAPPNTWKSWLLFYFSAHIAGGTNVLNKFATEKSKVMIINEEDSYRAVQDRFKLLGITDITLPMYFRIAQGSKIEKKFIDEVILELKEKDITTVIFDSLRAMHDAEENDSTEMQKILDQLKRIAREGITVIFTHHHRKKSAFTKNDDAEASRGSSAINAAVSGHISLDEDNRESGKYIIVRHLKSKAGEKIQPFEIKVDKQEDASIRFVYEGEMKTGEKKLLQAKETILNILSEEKGWKTVNDFVGMDIASKNTVRQALSDLEGQKLIKSMTRKEAKEKNVRVLSEGKLNEKVYASKEEVEKKSWGDFA